MFPIAIGEDAGIRGVMISKGVNHRAFILNKFIKKVRAHTAPWLGTKDVTVLGFSLERFSVSTLKELPWQVRCYNTKKRKSGSWKKLPASVYTGNSVHKNILLGSTSCTVHYVLPPLVVALGLSTFTLISSWQTKQGNWLDGLIV